MLPGLDGLEVLRRLRADPRGTAMRVIVLTAKGQRADREAALGRRRRRCSSPSRSRTPSWSTRCAGWLAEHAANSAPACPDTRPSGRSATARRATAPLILPLVGALLLLPPVAQHLPIWTRARRRAASRCSTSSPSGPALIVARLAALLALGAAASREPPARSDAGDRAAGANRQRDALDRPPARRLPRLCRAAVRGSPSGSTGARGQGGLRWLRSPLVYTLSISIYCTSWTFYGAVGSAARNGLEFATIYLGPTLVFVGWWWLLRKLVRIGRVHRITSIADLISSRYGKSPSLAVLVTLIAVIATTPYIALQLQSVTLELPGDRRRARTARRTAFWVAAGLAAFAVLFGTRNLDANERHHGVVAAIAVEAVVKLVALIAVGVFVVWGLAGGIGPSLRRDAGPACCERRTSSAPRWVALTFLVGDRRHLPAAPVPGDGGRERRRAPPAPRPRGCSRSTSS